MEHREGQLAALRAQREAKKDEGKEVIQPMVTSLDK